jgi:hypothetical protein
MNGRKKRVDFIFGFLDDYCNTVPVTARIEEWNLG